MRGGWLELELYANHVWGAGRMSRGTRRGCTELTGPEAEEKNSTAKSNGVLAVLCLCAAVCRAIESPQSSLISAGGRRTRGRPTRKHESLVTQSDVMVQNIVHYFF